MNKATTHESIIAGVQKDAGINPGKRKRKRIPLKKDEDKERDAGETTSGPDFEPTASFNKANPEEPEHKTPPVNIVRDPDGRAADDLVHEK